MLWRIPRLAPQLRAAKRGAFGCFRSSVGNRVDELSSHEKPGRVSSVPGWLEPVIWCRNGVGPSFHEPLEFSDDESICQGLPFDG